MRCKIKEAARSLPTVRPDFVGKEAVVSEIQVFGRERK
jgi:hypothetical protein